MNTNTLKRTITLLGTLLASTNITLYADQVAGSRLSVNDPPLTGVLVRDGVAVFAPELNQIMVLQRDGRATLDVTPIGYTYKCIDPVNPCVIR